MYILNACDKRSARDSVNSVDKGVGGGCAAHDDARVCKCLSKYYEITEREMENRDNVLKPWKHMLLWIYENPRQSTRIGSNHKNGAGTKVQ